MVALGKRYFTASPEALARWIPLVNGLMIILLAHGLAQLTWELLLPNTLLPRPMAQTQPIETIDPVTKRSSSPEYTAIADWHLFGQKDITPPAPPPTVEAPETRLNLKLVGIFFTRNNASGLALIAEPNGQERRYRVGDRVPGGARLERILRDHVVLERNGRREKLSLPKDSMDIINPPLASLSPPLRSNQEPLLAASQSINASAIASRVRQEIIDQPETLQDLASAVPYVRNGQFVGFRLRPGKNRQLLGQLGLQNGDVITQVNGIPIESPAQGSNLLQEMLHADQISIQVMRGDTEIPFTFLLNTP